MFLTIASAIPAFLWAIQSVRAGIGIMKHSAVQRFAPLDKSKCPRVSIVFAARNEAEKLPAAIASLLSLDYPDYEVIAVDDRSADATGKILDKFAAQRFATQSNSHHRAAARMARKTTRAEFAPINWRHGAWLVFTDADVNFRAGFFEADHDTRRHATPIDHLALMTQMTMVGFWERVVMTYFGLGFTLGTEPWQASNPKLEIYRHRRVSNDAPRSV